MKAMAIMKRTMMVKISGNLLYIFSFHKARKSSLWFLRITMALTKSDSTRNVTTPQKALPYQWPKSLRLSGSNDDRLIASMAMQSTE